MRFRLFCVFVIFPAALRCGDSPTPPPVKPAADELYEAGKSLFDEYAPDEIKQQYEFPSHEQWDEFAARLQTALDKEDLGELAAYEPEARAAAVALKVLPGYADLGEWMQERLDYIEAARLAAKQPPPKPGAHPALVTVPYYELWLARMRRRSRPMRADELMPQLRAAFTAEGVPPEIAWLAEAESTLNPAARSPAGAKGLFQLMPSTAQSLGLSTFLPDDRTNVAKSARAAARYLKGLYEKFGDWPLTFAAYNAGEGRVRRLMSARHARTFAEVAAALPSETRMYVPKVCATIAVRTGVTADRLPAPSAGG